MSTAGSCFNLADDSVCGVEFAPGTLANASMGISYGGAKVMREIPLVTWVSGKCGDVEWRQVM